MRGIGGLSYANFFAAARGIDPLEDLAPWVPEDAVVPPAAAPPTTLQRGANLIAAAEANPIFAPAPTRVTSTAPRERHRAITVAPEALVKANDQLGCVFTVELATGAQTYYTFRVNRAPQRADRPGRPPLFASLLTGPRNDDPRCYTYVGIVREPALTLQLTAKSAATAGVVVGLLTRVLEAIAFGALPPNIALIENSGSCSRCGRQLTHPESLRLGIGPDCAGKD